MLDQGSDNELSVFYNFQIQSKFPSIFKANFQVVWSYILGYNRSRCPAPDVVAVGAKDARFLLGDPQNLVRPDLLRAWFSGEKSSSFTHKLQ